jgi:hypothetical protein
MTADADNDAALERRRMQECLMLMSISVGAEGHAESAKAILRIATTMDQITDDVLMMLSTVDDTSQGQLLELILARVAQVGMALPLYEDAPSFFAPIVQQVRDILDRARPHMQ